MLSALIPSKHSYSALHLAVQLIHQRFVHHGPLVLMTGSLKSPAPTTDRDRTVSRRSEPSSRATLILLSPEYLLSFERWPFHAEPPDHYALVSYLFDLSVSQSSTLVPLHSTDDCQTSWGYLWEPPLLFWRRPPQSNYPPSNVSLSLRD